VPTTVVEIHVPLLPTPDLPDGAYPFPWIEEVEDFLSDLEDATRSPCGNHRGRQYRRCRGVRPRTTGDAATAPAL